MTQPKTWPAYLELHESGELQRRVDEAVASLKSCQVCPRNCKIDRLANETKVCHTGRLARVSSFFAHFGEEDCLRGSQGSGTIFFGFCNLKCVFCFHPETPIATDQGLRSIQDIFDACQDPEAHGQGWVGRPENVRVQSRQGTWVPVVNAFAHPFEGELVRLKPYSCPPLLLTPNHELFVADRSGQTRKVRADAVTRDHYLVIPKRTPGEAQVALDTLAILRSGTARLRSQRQRRVPSPQLVAALSSSQTSAVVGAELGYHGELEIEGKVEIAVVTEASLVRFTGENRPGIPASVPLDPDLAWLLGLFCAEGHVMKLKARPNAHRLVFSFGKHEQALQDRSIDLLKRIFGLKPSVVQRRTTVTVECGKTSAAVLFKTLCGSGAVSKRVPRQILDGTALVLRAFLDGYMRGDGTETRTHRVATTVSRDLALGLYELGLHLNALPSFHESNPPSETVIEGRLVRQRTLYFVKFKKDRLDGSVDPKREHTKWRDLGDRFLVPIHRIGSVPHSGRVYNLEVDDADHSYLAPFVAVSNCQNHSTSQTDEGMEITPEQLADMMLDLQAQGCHNINWVTPEHVVPQILESLPIAIERGLRLPIVYNTSAYDSMESMRWMDGIVDIYMPDFKLWEKKTSIRYLKAKDYRPVACEILKEMHRQVGALQVDEQGLARRGVLVRHLVMPGLLDETRRIFEFLKEEISPDTYVNVMGQYRPEYKASDYEEINRRPTEEEMLLARRHFHEAGLKRIDKRRPLGRLPMIFRLL